MSSVKLTIGDLVAGRAYIRFPLAAKLNLAHWAGAPWADRNEDAFLHALQVEVLAHKERELIVHGASRLGKSVLGGVEILLALHSLGAKVGVFAARWSHVAHEFQYAHAGIKKLYGQHPGAIPRNMYRDQGNNQQYHIVTAWNAIARGFSTADNDGAAALGQEFTHIVLGEGSHISPWVRQRVLQRAIDGALMNQRFPREDIGRMFVFTTPKSFEGCAAHRVDQIRKDFGTQRACEYGLVDWPDTVWIREAAISENPAYDLRAMEAARKQLDPAAFAEQYLGLMVFRSGRVYEEFEESMVVDPPEDWRGMRLALGIDTGANAAGVLVGVDPEGVLWVLADSYLQKRDIDVVCERIKAMVCAATGLDWDKARAVLKHCYPDPSSQYKQEIRNRTRLGIRHPNRREGAFELLPTIDQMRALMANGRFKIVKHCTATLDQIRKYVWKETKIAGAGGQVDIREPKKVDDHCLDAMRYAAIPTVEMGALPEPEGPPLTLQEAQERQFRDAFWGDMKRRMKRGSHNPIEELSICGTGRSGA